MVQSFRIVHPEGSVSALFSARGLILINARASDAGIPGITLFPRSENNLSSVQTDPTRILQIQLTLSRRSEQSFKLKNTLAGCYIMGVFLSQMDF